MAGVREIKGDAMNIQFVKFVAFQVGAFGVRSSDLPCSTIGCCHK